MKRMLFVTTLLLTVALLQAQPLSGERLLRALGLTEDEIEQVLPYSPHADPIAAPMLIIASVAANSGTRHEFGIDPRPRDAWYTPRLSVSDGSVAVPSAPGLGFDFDVDYVLGGELVLRLSA